jgi:hypothetical protein
MACRQCGRALPVVLALLLAAGCTGKTEDPGRYHSEAGGFSLVIPEDWEKQENVMGCALTALSPLEGQGDQFRENVNVVVEELPRKLSLDDYVGLSRQNQEKLMTDFNVEKEADAKIGEIAAKQLVYTHRMGQINAKLLQYVLVEGKKGFAVTCTATPESYDKYVEQFQTIVNSLKVE